MRIYNKRPWTKERLAARIIITASGCWEWQGARDSNGYGSVRIDGAADRVHRLAWRLHRGPIGNGNHLCHTCDNPPCCNPEHLFEGDARANILDMRAKGRHGTAKITQAGADEIRAEYASGLRQVDIAAARSISQRQVSDIVTGRCWAPVKRVVTKHHLSPDIVRSIRAANDNGLSQSALARQHGITQSGVWRIVHRLTWKNIA